MERVLSLSSNIQFTLLHYLAEDEQDSNTTAAVLSHPLCLFSFHAVLLRQRFEEPRCLCLFLTPSASKTVNKSIVYRTKLYCLTNDGCHMHRSMENKVHLSCVKPELDLVF